MLFAKYTLLVVGVLLLVTWLVSIVAIVLGMRRRLARAHDAGGPRSRPLPIGAVAGVPLAALALTVNLVVFIGALCWYRLRGKPLPPPPRFG
jgi:hypothetical protein